MGTEHEDQLARLSAKLEDLAKLEHNWNTYGARPPNAEELAWGRKVIALCAEHELYSLPRGVGASAQGGIGFQIYEGDLYAELAIEEVGECDPNECISVILDDAKSATPSCRVFPLTDDGLMEAIEAINELVTPTIDPEIFDRICKHFRKDRILFESEEDDEG